MITDLVRYRPRLVTRSIRPPRRRTRTPLLALAPLAIAVLAGTPEGLAQDAPPPTPQPTRDQLADRPVRRITFQQPVPGSDPLRFEPLTGESLGLTENFIETRVGQIYDEQSVNADIRRLNRLGRFAEITADATILSDGGLHLVYTLMPAPIIRDVQIPANTTVRARDIEEVVDLLQNAPANRLELDRAARAIEDLYRDKGYPNVTVTWDQSELEQTGVVFFQIVEGSRVTVSDIRFQFSETQSFSPARLKSQIQTETVGILRKGRLDDELLIDDAAALIRFYQDRGFLDARVQTAPTRISPNGREAIVTFLVEEGPRYTLRNVQVFYPRIERRVFDTREQATANAPPGEEVVAIAPAQYAVFRPEPYSSAQIAGLIPLKRGDVFALSAVRQSMRRLENAFGDLGHVNVRMDTEALRYHELRVPDEPGKMDLRIDVVPGERFRTGLTESIGNHQTKTNVILHDVELRPDRPLSAADIRRSRERLIRRGLFNVNPGEGPLPDITIQDEDPLFPGYRDVLVEVQETTTRRFSFGGAVSSDLGATASFRITEQNFDLLDFPDSLDEFIRQRSFRGGGQTFNLTLAPGTELQTYSIGVTDPTLLDSDYAGSASLQFRNRQFREFDEERLGGRIGFGRNFGRRWNGRAVIRAEQVGIFDIEPDNPVDFFESEGTNFITGLALELTRNTTDHRLIPSRGSRTQIAIEQVGLFGGDYLFNELHAEHAMFITLYEDYDANRTILELRGEVGWIPQGNDEAPVFERLYRGGRSFRGFDFRTIAPKGIRNDTGEQSNDPIGGSWEFFLGAELTQPVFEDVFAIAFFIDSGTVQEDIGFDEYRVSFGAGIRLITPLSPAPIAVDFGFPLLSEELDEERLITFTIDVPF